MSSIKSNGRTDMVDVNLPELIDTLKVTLRKRIEYLSETISHLKQKSTYYDTFKKLNNDREALRDECESILRHKEAWALQYSLKFSEYGKCLEKISHFHNILRDMRTERLELQKWLKELNSGKEPNQKVQQWFDNTVKGHELE